MTFQKETSSSLLFSVIRNQISYHMSELLKDKQSKTKGNKCCEVTLSVRYILSIFLHSKKITFNLRVAVPPSPQGETEGVLLEKKGTATRTLHCIQRFYKKKIPLRTSLPKIQGNKGNQGKKELDLLLIFLHSSQTVIES